MAGLNYAAVVAHTEVAGVADTLAGSHAGNTRAGAVVGRIEEAAQDTPGKPEETQSH